jgi:hypothetical protein
MGNSYAIPPRRARTKLQTVLDELKATDDANGSPASKKKKPSKWANCAGALPGQRESQPSSNLRSHYSEQIKPMLK